MVGSTRPRIGFLGTGIMGLPMARRLVEAGHEVRAWNRTREKAERLAAAGAAVVATPRDAVRHAEVAICMLSSGPVCDEVLLGGGAALAEMGPGSTLVVMSSIPVRTAQAHARAAAGRNVGYLDAPVSGGEKGAAEGTLAILVGGEEAVVERVRPVLEVMGRPTHVGPAGAGELAKSVNQLIVAGTITVVAEALLLAERGGADPAKVREAILGGFAHSHHSRAARAPHDRERLQTRRPREAPAEGHRDGDGVGPRTGSGPTGLRAGGPAVRRPCRARRRRTGPQRRHP